MQIREKGTRIGRASSSCRRHIMNIMRRRVLQLVGIGAVTIASPTLASALDAEAGGVYRTAMGPVSAPLKPGGPPSNSATTTPSESPRMRPHHGYRHRRPHSIVPTR
jgi:hypothetical protein